MKVRFAATPPAAALAPGVFPDYLAALETLGFDTLWLSDIPLGPLGDPLVSLVVAAQCTRHIKLGANVVPLGRNPLWLAKQLAQIDQVSEGRLLLSFVPGLGPPAERAALGYTTRARNRGVETEAIMGLLRRWWAGESVQGTCEGFTYDDIEVHPRPRQQPLEIWLGGKARAALERVARAADGWLTSAVTPAEAAAGRQLILDTADGLGRRIDEEHFGISIPFSETEPQEEALAALRARRADRDLSDVVAVGRGGLRQLVQAHLDVGISKFVLRPLAALDAELDWRADLHRMAEAVLDLQK